MLWMSFFIDPYALLFIDDKINIGYPIYLNIVLIPYIVCPIRRIRR
jgi:hypothetical protein